eukprot:1187871-Prorocentrum_minimum.AAC.2
MTTCTSSYWSIPEEYSHVRALIGPRQTEYSHVRAPNLSLSETNLHHRQWGTAPIRSVNFGGTEDYRGLVRQLDSTSVGDVERAPLAREGSARGGASCRPRSARTRAAWPPPRPPPCSGEHDARVKHARVTITKQARVTNIKQA